MTKILGLDLGTNSIGWAVVENEKKEILGTGVRIFLNCDKNNNKAYKKKKLIAKHK